MAVRKRKSGQVGAGRLMLLDPTKEILKRIPGIRGTESTDCADKIVHLKYFSPVGAATWYIVEYDPATRECFGFCNLGDLECAEWGVVTLEELESITFRMERSGNSLRFVGAENGRGSLGIERDLHWHPKRFGDIRELQGTGVSKEECPCVDCRD